MTKLILSPKMSVRTSTLPSVELKKSYNKTNMPQKASEANLLKQFSLLIQGPPGSGKTTLALQFPRAYICDLDNNIAGTIRYMRRNNIPIEFEYDTPDIMPDGLTLRPVKDRYNFMSTCIKEVSSRDDIDTIIIDGVSKLDLYIKGEIARQKGRAEGEMTLPDWNDHGYIWQSFVTKLQASPKMFILLSHEEIDESGRVLVNMQGKKIQSSLAGMFSDVWRTEVEIVTTPSGKGHEFKVRCMPTGTLSLKNSLGLPNIFKMDWKTVKAALEKGLTPTK